MRRGALQLGALLAAGVLLAGCAEDVQVGSDELLQFDEKNPNGPRLGARASETESAGKTRKRRRARQAQQAQQAQPQPTPEPQPTPQPAQPRPRKRQQQPQQEPQQEPRKQAAAQQQQQQEPQDTGPVVALEIKITGDQSGTSQFDPSAARIYEGTCAEWKNTDTVVRSVEADDGTFSSGDLKPGATWQWCPKATGKVNYHDGTRPYAVAYIEVVPR